MNKISFGRVILPPYYQDRTLKQSAIQDVINNVFSMPRPVQSAATIVHKNLRADILVKHLRNGNTEIKFIESKKPQNIIFSERYIYENIGNFSINAKDHLFTICEKLEAYADKCVEASERYRTGN